MPEADPLLELDRLSVAYGQRAHFGRKRVPFVALDEVSLTVSTGEALGIVGESGAGKSTLARCVVGVQRPVAGSLRFDGEPIATSTQRSRATRRAIQMIFQDPHASLNPRMTVGAVLTELLRVHGLASSRAAARARSLEVIELVGLPATALDLRPRAFSGGQRQRIGIARALILEPRLLVADEPVSALDVSVQASILLLLKELQHALKLTVLMISHDLAVVHQFCDRVGVMRDGRLIELNNRETLFSAPQDPYTRELLAAATDLPELEVPASVARRHAV